MSTRAAISMEDYDGESSTVLLWVQDVSAVNFGSVSQDVDELKDAIATISLGAIRDASINKSYPESPATVTDKTAQRESKWLITYRDTTQFLDAANTIANPGYLKVFTTEIPAAKLSLLSNNSDELDLAETTVAAFVTVFEANARSPYNHSANAPTIDVLSIKHVGRRA